MPTARFIVPWIAAAALSAGGCDRADPSGAARATRLRLGYFPNIAHAQAVLGVASGDFARAMAPARLETKLFSAGPALIEALHAGEIDVGYIGPGPALNAFARSRGEAIRIIAGASADGVRIVARKDSGIRSMSDLRGKRIATPQLGNTQDLAARRYLSHVLQQADTSSILPIPNAEQAAMMVRGEIDAAWAPEPWASRLIAETGGVLLADERELRAGRHATLAVVITTPAFLERNRELLIRFLVVHRDWTRRLADDPQTHLPALGDALNALTGKALPADVFQSAASRTHFTIDPIEDSIREYAAWTHELGFASQPIDVKGLIDSTLMASLE